MCPVLSTYINFHSISSYSISVRTARELSSLHFSPIYWFHSTRNYRGKGNLCCKLTISEFVFCFRVSLWVCRWYFCEFLLNLLLEIMRILWHSFKELYLTFFPTILENIMLPKCKYLQDMFFFRIRTRLWFVPSGYLKKIRAYLSVAPLLWGLEV